MIGNFVLKNLIYDLDCLDTEKDSEIKLKWFDNNLYNIQEALFELKARRDEERSMIKE